MISLSTLAGTMEWIQRETERETDRQTDRQRQREREGHTITMISLSTLAGTMDLRASRDSANLFCRSGWMVRYHVRGGTDSSIKEEEVVAEEEDDGST